MDYSFHTGLFALSVLYKEVLIKKPPIGGFFVELIQVISLRFLPV